MIDYIIKGCGNINDITTALKTLCAAFGKGAPLSYVATVARYNKITQAERKQFEKDGKNS